MIIRIGFLGQFLYSPVKEVFQVVIFQLSFALLLLPLHLHLLLHLQLLLHNIFPDLSLSHPTPGSHLFINLLQLPSRRLFQLLLSCKLCTFSHLCCYLFLKCLPLLILWILVLDTPSLGILEWVVKEALRQLIISTTLSFNFWLLCWFVIFAFVVKEVRWNIFLCSLFLLWLNSQGWCF